MLSACLGGTLAQQIARSIATSIADKAVANALDVDENAKPQPRRHAKLEDRAPDEMWMALATTRFNTAAPIPQTPSPQAIASAAPEAIPMGTLQANALVSVQLFNLLIGEEKNAVFTQARALGALNLPEQREWPSWRVATGMAEKENTLITFLIPPIFGKLPSGTVTMVELAHPGELNIARYLQE